MGEGTMSKPESLDAAMAGLSVNPEDLSSAADWVDKLSTQWDRDTASYFGDKISPLLRKFGDKQAKVITANPHGHFDEATNLHDDVFDAHHVLLKRAMSINTMLDQLASGLRTIAQSYASTEALNHADQQKLLATLDGGMTSTDGPGADPGGQAV
jgi:hypothetical protein